MGKRHKKKKYKNKDFKIELQSTATSSDIRKAALEVFGSTYFTLSQS